MRVEIVQRGMEDLYLLKRIIEILVIMDKIDYKFQFPYI